MSLDFNVYDVERGLAVSLKTPNGYGILIDCGSSEKISPVSFLLRIQSHPELKFTPWKECLLSCFILTHPHSDHISDIESLHKNLYPPIIYNRRDLDWNRVKKSNQSNTTFDFYKKNFFPPYYNYNEVTPNDLPSWGDGMTINVYDLNINSMLRDRTFH
jgi:glyoxylase-like metal-dependent hydrolase (beta-lactamase superfamily II)